MYTSTILYTCACILFKYRYRSLQRSFRGNRPPQYQTTGVLSPISSSPSTPTNLSLSLTPAEAEILSQQMGQAQPSPVASKKQKSSSGRWFSFGRRTLKTVSQTRQNSSEDDDILPISPMPLERPPSFSESGATMEREEMHGEERRQLRERQGGSREGRDRRGASSERRERRSGSGERRERTFDRRERQSGSGERRERTFDRRERRSGSGEGRERRERSGSGEGRERRSVSREARERRSGSDLTLTGSETGVAIGSAEGVTETSRLVVCMDISISTESLILIICTCIYMYVHCMWVINNVLPYRRINLNNV